VTLIPVTFWDQISFLFLSLGFTWNHVTKYLAQTLGAKRWSEAPEGCHTTGGFENDKCPGVPLTRRHAALSELAKTVDAFSVPVSCGEL